MNNEKKEYKRPNGCVQEISSARPKFKMNERVTSPILEKIISSKHDRMRREVDQSFCKCRT